MRNLAISLVTTFLLLAQSTFAADQGDSEISIFGNIFTDGDFTNANANFTYGYFVSDQLLWNVGLGVNWFNADIGENSVSQEQVSATTGIQYLFSDQGSTPYIKASYQALDIEEISDTSVVDAFLGYRSYFTENAALFYEAGYRTLVDDFGGSSFFVGNIGLVYTFD